MKPENMIRILVLVSLFLFTTCNQNDLKIGDIAPAFTKMEWIQSPPLILSDLKGKVVLIRWWTDQCIYCVQSADALNTWHKSYSDSGLVVIGLYHPKPLPKQCDIEEIREFAMEKEFQFPIAIDNQWTNLKKFKGELNPENFTSLSFLIGKDSKIIYIHPGGEYHETLEKGHENCVRDYYEIQQRIQLAIRSK